MFNPSISTTMKLQFGELNITPRVEERLRELDFTVPELQDAIDEHKSPCDGEPSVYCGTYGKYNDGTMGDTIPTDEDLKKGFATIPNFPGNE